MKWERFNHYKKYIISFSFVLSQVHAFADPSPQDLKGMSQALEQKSSRYSPTLGYVVSSTDLLQLVRFLESKESIHELAIILFPSPNGQFLIPSQVPSNPISHLDPELIGQIIEYISHLDEHRIQDDPDYLQELQDQVSGIILKKLSPQGHQKFLKSKNKRLQNAIRYAHKQIMTNKNVSAETTSKIEKRIQYLEKILKEDQVQDEVRPQVISQYASRWGEGQVSPFSKALIHSLRDQIIKKPSTYSHITPTSLLLGFLWRKSKNQQDLYSYLSSLKSHLKSNLKNQPMVEEKGYSTDEVRSLALALPNFDERKLAEVYHQDPDLFFIALNDFRYSNSRTPPDLGTQTSYIRLKDKDEAPKGIADCVETSLRYILNFLVSVPSQGKFDAQILKNLKSNQNLPVSEDLIQFYENHSHMGQSVSQDVRDHWVNDVLVKLKDPEIERQSDAITGSFHNVFRVLANLIFGPEYLHLSHSKKMDVLCRTFSRPGFILDWYPNFHHPKEALDTMDYGRIILTLNGRDAVTYSSEHAHHHAYSARDDGQNSLISGIKKLAFAAFSEPLQVIDFETIKLALNEVNHPVGNDGVPSIDGSPSQIRDIQYGIEVIKKSVANESSFYLDMGVFHLIAHYPQFLRMAKDRDPNVVLPRPHELIQSLGGEHSGINLDQDEIYFTNLFELFLSKNQFLRDWLLNSISQSYPTMKKYSQIFEKALFDPRLRPSQFLAMKDAFRPFLVQTHPNWNHFDHQFEYLLSHAEPEARKELVTSLNHYQGSDFRDILHRLAEDPVLEVAQFAAWRAVVANQFRPSPVQIIKMLRHKDPTLVALAMMSFSSDQPIPPQQMVSEIEKRYGVETLMNAFEALISNDSDQDCFSSIQVEALGANGIEKQAFPLLAPDSPYLEYATIAIRSLLQRVQEIGPPNLASKALEIQTRCYKVLQ